MNMNIDEIIEELDKLARKHEVCAGSPSLKPLAETYRRTAKILRAAIEKLKTHPDNQSSKTADPVHVAGGCYCRECLRGKKASAEKIACPLSTVYRLPTDFCSDGKSKQIDFEAKEETP